jgi:chitin disaccharide deacetylase
MGADDRQGTGPLTTGPAGELFSPTPAGRAAFLDRARLDEVELEFRAQINAVADAGLTPTHLDFHCLADGGRDDILDLAVVLAAEYGLAVRVWLEPGRRGMRRRGLPVTDNDFRTASPSRS